MKIVDQGYEIVEYPENPLQMVETAARNCYQSYDKIGCTIEEPEPQFDCPPDTWWSGPIDDDDKDYVIECKQTLCKNHSSHKLIKACIKKGHESVLEHPVIAIRLITNRGVMAELTRHRIGIAFSIESTRYIKYDEGMEFVRPVWWDAEKEMTLHSPEWVWLGHMEASELTYRKLLGNGWRPEMAREVLPNSLKTEIIMSGNYRSFRHLFKLRTSKAAHPQFRNLMLPLLSDLKERIPVIFDDIGEK